MWRVIKRLSFIILGLFLLACTEAAEQQKIRIGINPWPGYEFIYLADQKGFFDQQGLDIEVLELSSLADVTRVLEQGRLDAMASTLSEAVEVAVHTPMALEIALVTDFSNGSDVMLAHQSIDSVADLKGKKVGVELGLLGSYILQLALNKYGLSNQDVEIVNVEQLVAKKKLFAGEVDAVITYPPFSTMILRDRSYQQIFSTRETPEKVIDIIAFRKGVLVDPQQWQQKFFKAWQQALDYSHQNPQDAYSIMAEREGISVDEFAVVLEGAALIDSYQQHSILNSEKLQVVMHAVCDVMKEYDARPTDCSILSSKLTVVSGQ